MGESVDALRIEPFTHTRKELGLEFLDPDLLRAQAGSQDPQQADEARKKLLALWDLPEERDAKNAETKDLLQQFEQFSEEEKKLILENLAGLQLTEGCNGGCYFCLFGTKKGVIAKYSFSSIRAFLEKYGSKMNQQMVFYWDSDPFDYRDIDEQENLHTFVDVYKVFRQKQQETCHYVSTSIPRGSTNDFIQFMLYAFDEDKLRQQQGKNPILTVRISWAKHNVQRVEATIIKLKQTLINKGYSEEEVDNFFERCLISGCRFENDLKKIGPLINQHNNMLDIETPACRDGILIRPNSIDTIMMTAPTIYEPSGQKSIPLSPGQIDLIPLYLSRLDYEGYDQNSSTLRFKSRLMLPPIRKAADPNQELTLPNQKEDIVLKLGRETYTLGRLRDDIANFLDYYYQHLGKVTLTQGEIFFQEIANSFRERQKYTQQQIEKARRYLSTNPQEAEKIEYYILLAQVYLSEMDLLATLIERNFFITTVVMVANGLKKIGKNEVAQLPTAIESLIKISEIVSNKELSEDEKRKQIEELSPQAEVIVSKIFDLTNPDTNKNWWTFLI